LYDWWVDCFSWSVSIQFLPVNQPTRLAPCIVQGEQ
jgi:hypothetical protein